MTEQITTQQGVLALLLSIASMLQKDQISCISLKTDADLVAGSTRFEIVLVDTPSQPPETRPESATVQ